MGTLQGMPKSILDTLIKAVGNERTVAGALGDAMSINVVMRLLPRALFSVGLLDTLPKDVWKVSSDASEALQPDTLFR